MKKAIAALTALTLLAGPAPASAALTPSKERAKEVNAVVDAVQKKLPQHPINTVMYIRSNNFEVLAGPCTVRAHIVSSKHKKTEKADVKVRLGKLRCGR